MKDLWDTVPQIGNARQNLSIKVYVRQKDELLAEEEEQAKLSLRAVNMSDWETSTLEEDLGLKGFVHFHWGGW